jgi:RNA polymerase sigma factor (sigma-70 family)
MDDHQLLERYVAEGSEDAFTELVGRHMGLVYSAALRQVRDPQLAQDVTQVVFTNLARKSRSIQSSKGLVAGWLHRDTRFTALDLLRAEARRCRREQEAIAMNETEPSSDWGEIRPLLDEALDELGPADRDALLLRFFGQRDLAGVGAALGTSAEAARKRVDRALDRLHDHLVRRGITTTAGALVVALSAHALEPLPAALAATLVSSSALASAAAPAGAVGWVLNLMIMTKTKIAVGAVLLSTALVTPLLLQSHALAQTRAEQAELLARAREAPDLAAPTPPPAALVPATDNQAERDRADLERLRREAPVLRTQLSQLITQARALAKANPSLKGMGKPIGETLSDEELSEAGQATPAALWKTYMWAMSHAETNRLSQLVTFEPGTDEQTARRIMEMLRKRAEAAAQARKGRAPEEAGAVVRLLEERPAQNNDSWLVLEEVAADGQSRRGRFLLRGTDAGWKLVVGQGANVRPAVETSDKQL